MMNADAHLKDYMLRWGARAVPFQNAGHSALFETDTNTNCMFVGQTGIVSHSENEKNPILSKEERIP